MPVVIKQPDLMQVVLNIQKRLRVLENGTRLTSSSIQTNGASALTVFGAPPPATPGATGPRVAQLGDIPFSDGSHRGMAAFSTGGDGAAFAATTDPSGKFNVVTYDANGNAVFSMNTAAPGMGRPYLPVALFPIKAASLESSQSATFETVLQGAAVQTHAALDFLGQVAADAATTGEMKLLVNGAQVGATISIPAGVFTDFEITPTTIPGSVGGSYTFLSFAIQLRRLTGTGSVYVAPTWLQMREP